jgi:hypothetical protein
MSKEHTLSDAIEYIKKLQNQVQELQQQLDESPDDAWDKQGSASCSASVAAATENTQVPCCQENSHTSKNKSVSRPSCLFHWIIEIIGHRHQFEPGCDSPHRFPKRHTTLLVSAGPGGAGSSGAAQVPPQGLLQEGRRLHQGAGSALRLQRTGYQPQHHNVLRLRGERLLHRGERCSRERASSAATTSSFLPRC